MDTLRAFLVISLAILAVFVVAEASQPSNPTKVTLPDFLAPFRGIFKKKPSGHHGQPVRMHSHSPKDSSGSETTKYPGHGAPHHPHHRNPPGPSGGGGGGEEGGFRPYFPTGFDESRPLMGGESSTSSRPFSTSSSPDHYYRPRPAASSRIPRQQSHITPGGGYHIYPPQYENQIEQQPQQQDAPGGFTDFGFGGGPDFGPSYNSPQHAHHGHGQGGHHQGQSQEFGPPETSSFAPVGHHHSRPQGPPRRRPYRGQRHSQEYMGNPNSGPQGYRPYQPSPAESSYSNPQNYQQEESFGSTPYDTRGEPQIITLEDLQREHPIPGARTPYFGEGYTYSESPATTNNLVESGPSSAHIRHIPAFSTIPVEDPNNNYYGSQPGQRYGMRPYNNGNNNGGVSDEMYQETKPGKQVVRGPRRLKPMHLRSPRPTHASPQPEIHYGKPMLMSSSTPPAVVAPPKRFRVRPFKKPIVGGDKPILLASPKIPNFMKSASIQNPVVQSYEPQTAASGYGHGGGGGDFEGIQSNGDRILYHVAGHQGPYSYRFGYDTGKGYNRLFRFEEKDGQGFVKGRYGFYDKHGKMNVVNYEAHPQHGFSAQRGH